MAKREQTSGERQEVHLIKKATKKAVYLRYKWFSVNKNGTRISGKFKNLSDFRQNIAIFERNEKKGIVDINGKEILDKLYDNVSLDQDIIRICENGKWGLANLEGKIICQPKYEFIERFNNNGYARIAFRDKSMQEFHWGVINKKGSIIISPNYYYLGSLDKPLIIAQNFDGFGIIDINGKSIVPFKYGSLRSNGEGEVLYNSAQDQYCI